MHSRRLEVAVRGGDDARVDLDRLTSADTLDLALLKHAEELRLHGQRHVADLVEEESPSARALELAAALLCRPRERAHLVTEELALDQLARQGRAVELLERTLRAWRHLVNGLRDELLARPLLFAGRGRRRALRRAVRSAHRAGSSGRAGADEVPDAGGDAERPGLGFCAAEAERGLDGDEECVGAERLRGS